MKLVVFGLTVSSSWGNGHATVWRALIRGLSELGHRVVFFERDVPYYAAHRDLVSLRSGAAGGESELVLYPDWADAAKAARTHLAGADAAMVTSYCPDALPATELVLGTDVPARVFYDLDTPVTMQRLRSGEPVAYLGPEGLAGFDVVLSFTGGLALDALRSRLGARRAFPLYGSADPAIHRPAVPRPGYAAALSYLGTHSADRQEGVESFFLEPARRLPRMRFALAGAQYPADLALPPNVARWEHLPPPEHAAFYASSPLTLNVTRGPMAAMGFCPSGRLFEAAACGVPILSDWWEGLDDFFTPGEEILIARTAEDAVDAIRRDPGDLARIGRAARARALDEHTPVRRAEELVACLERAAEVDVDGDGPEGTGREASPAT